MFLLPKRQALILSSLLSSSSFFLFLPPNFATLPSPFGSAAAPFPSLTAFLFNPLIFFNTVSAPSDNEREITLEIPPKLHRTRADKALSSLYTEMSRTRLQRLFEEGHIWRDGVALIKKAAVHEGDVITIELPPARPLELKPVDIPLDILYEDAHIVVLNKQAGLIVHPGAGTGEDTLVHALLHHCGDSLTGIGGVERPGIVHRLDKDTTGVMVVAKTEKALDGLANAFAERIVEKTYWALTVGVPELLSGSIKDPIARDPHHRTRMAVIASGKPAHSDWKKLEVFSPRHALLEVKIHTGRTHQIRVHLAARKWTLLGDSTYGFNPKGALEATVSRPMLHAHTLAFAHPITEEWLSFEAPLPSDFSELLQKLRSQPIA